MNEQGAANDVRADAVSTPGGGAKKFLMIFVPGLLVQAALAYILVAKVFAPPEPPKEPQPAPALEKQGQIYLVEDVIVNPAGSEGRRFVNTTVGLEYFDSATGSELDARHVQLRDLLISVFAARTVQELDGISEKEEIKEEILNDVNQMISRGRVVRVYFVDFVMQ